MAKMKILARIINQYENELRQTFEINVYSFGGEIFLFILLRKYPREFFRISFKKI